MIESVTDCAIVILSREGLIRSWNAGAERINGYRSDEIIGCHFSVFYPESDRLANKPRRELVVAARDGRFEEEGLRVRRDGSSFWAHVAITPVFGPHGALRGFCKVVRDMTEVRLEQELRSKAEKEETKQAQHQAERMEELEQVKTDFLTLVSHEMRGPVAVLGGYLSMLDDGTLDPSDLKQVLPTMTSKVREMEAMAVRILETAGLQDSRLELSRREIDCRDIAAAAVEVKRSQLNANQRLELDLAEDSAMVVGDRYRLETVVANLIDNAIKYSPSGGAIAVRVWASGDGAFISVTDQGIGIDADVFPHLFDRYSRFVPSQYKEIPGTGLGLHLSRELARRHGGDILVESFRGIGSRFTLVLRRAGDSASTMGRQRGGKQLCSGDHPGLGDHSLGGFGSCGQDLEPSSTLVGQVTPANL
jgi:PAS domain S-box-containing protein